MKGVTIYISATPRSKVLDQTGRNFVTVKANTKKVNKTRVNHYAKKKKKNSIPMKYIKQNVLGRQQK